MSAKEFADKEKPGFPWTARQVRRKVGKRLARKQLRKSARNK